MYFAMRRFLNNCVLYFFIVLLCIFLQDGYGEQFGASYRTIQKLFDLLILRKVQAEAHSSRSEQLHKEGHAGSHGQSHGGNAAGGAGKDKDREHAANRRKSSFGLASGGGGGGGGSVGIASNSDETDGTTSGDSSSDDAAPFTFSLSVSMMEIYNEQVRTAIQC
jgi:hypothetical protein